MPPPDRTEDPVGRLDGLALVLTFLVSGLLCLAAPRFFHSHGWQTTAWHVTGIVLGVLAVGGAAVEGSKLTASEALGDFGVGIAFLLIAGSLGWASEAHLHYHMAGSLKILTCFFIFFGMYGLFRGVFRMFGSQRQTVQERRPLRRSEQVVAIVVGLSGLATAVLNFLGTQRSPGR
jgi:hypothetical protein